MNQETLQKLKQMLPKGAQAKVARQLGMSPSSVSEVLRGKIKAGAAFRILELLVEEVNNHKETERTKVEKLTEAINNF